MVVAVPEASFYTDPPLPSAPPPLRQGSPSSPHPFAATATAREAAKPPIPGTLHIDFVARTQGLY